MATTPQEYKIGIYYFGVWSHKDSNVLPQALQTYGRQDWWAGTRDFHGDTDHLPPIPINTENWKDDFSHLKPLIGYYDNSQKETLERQINQAKAHGISFFNFYWYWDPVKKQEKYNDGLDTFLTAQNNNSLEFMVSICAHPWGLEISATNAPLVVETIISKYLSKSHYLKTKDNRPIIFLLDSRGIKNGKVSDIQDFIALLKQQVNIKLGVNPFVLVNSETPTNKEIINADGYSCLNYFGASLVDNTDKTGNYDTYNSKLTNIFNSFADKPYIPCLMSDFNEKPRTRFVNNPSAIRYVDNWSLEKFTTGLTNIKSYLNNTNQGVVDGYVSLYAWNEWRESGYNLEPSEKHQDRMLNEVAKVFNLSINGDEDCRLMGYCAGIPPPPSTGCKLCPNGTKIKKHPDYDCDNNVNLKDLISWYTDLRTHSHNLYADFNCDGQVDTADLIEWYKIYKLQ